MLPGWHAQTADVCPELFSKSVVQVSFRVQEKLYGNTCISQGSGSLTFTNIAKIEKQGLKSSPVYLQQELLRCLWLRSFPL